MAFRRSLSIRSLLRSHRYRPSHSCAIPLDHDHARKCFLQAPLQRSYHSYFHQSFRSNSAFSLNLRGYSNSPPCPPLGFALYRPMSTAHGAGSDEPDSMDDMVEAITNSALENAASQATLANELAKAASDCTIPVAAAQNLIDMVHSFTGLNWWASIVLTTLLIQGVAVPLVVGSLRIILHKMGMDPAPVAESAGSANGVLQRLYTPGGVCRLSTLFIPIVVPIEYTALAAMSKATYDMAGNISSFKTGGALWFTDLTTMDASGIFPVLLGLTLLIDVERVMKGQRAMKGFEQFLPFRQGPNVVRCLAILMAICSISAAKATHCFWITWALFSLISSHVLKRPGIKKFLGIPVVSGICAETQRRLFWFGVIETGLVLLFVF
ncbi:PREDICTED: mitochondrial inner membrane protein OXA1-like isoform X2 [Tarenaya hassleriana]|uniref:mitochondrial inner membrane protein OXA1-like isoform X2 n=1 Tax=Tarenaya hassleriana TaxID=28532 RepID=UPI00053C1469|nr:PREDICTED: mitochondrial inner membrane protein OXA1-like isoform X2 [Tarenaya hassleriana]